VVFVLYKVRATLGMVILGILELEGWLGLSVLVVIKGGILMRFWGAVFKIGSLEERTGETSLLRLVICPRRLADISFLNA